MATASRQASNGAKTAELTRTALDEAIEATLSRERVSWKVADTGEELQLSISHVRKLFANPTKSGKLPSDRECWLFLQMCKARGLNPYVGDAFLVGYDDSREATGAKFNLITSHQALLKRAESSGKKTGVESGVIVMDKKTKETAELVGDFYDESTQSLVGAWCKVYRKDYDLPVYERLKFSVYNKGYSRWKDDPGGMIVKCAEAAAHRVAFPAEVGGLYVREEVHGDDRLSDERPAAKRVRVSQLASPVEDFEQPTHAEDASQVEPDAAPAKPKEYAPDGSELPGELFDNQQDATEL